MHFANLKAKRRSQNREAFHHVAQFSKDWASGELHGSEVVGFTFVCSELDFGCAQVSVVGSARIFVEKDFIDTVMGIIPTYLRVILKEKVLKCS